ncbi:MATE family efflux transporter [Sphingorhabdus contaminans]|uniref:MATE family efflux transporter n=1 Tax=Sphingorhabdus contaminans TaxID=1343899 RepID=A0A553WB03_9SPHN|nr:MATE family efflux transporter [Sphingorhabdus contaminans]TSB01867.1 MATE family efflux transporter [Sphingorhabdus contaminans]
MTAPAHQRDLTVGPVARTLFLFALPSLGVNILQSLNNSVNSIWIGQFLGEEALAASANAGLIMFLMFSALFGFSMATTILIGQNMGRRDVESVRRVMGTATGIFFVSGAVIAVFGWIFAPNLLRLMATPEGAYPLALAYLRVMFLSMPTSFVMILISSSLRGVGDSVTPFWNTVLNVGLDIVLNPVFILGLGPIPAMGIAGSALATLIASIISLALLIRKVYAKDLTIRLRGAELKWIRPDARFLKPIARMGLPMGLSMIIMSGSAVVMIGLVNREGVDTTAAFGVMNQLWSYVQMPAVAVGSAVSAMVAQNIGANNWARVDRAVWSGIVINLIMSGILVLLTTVFATPLLGLFLPEGSPAIAIAIHINHVIGWSFILMGISVVVTFAVRANGAVLAPLLILIFSAIVVRFSVGYGLHDCFGANAIWGAFIATSIVSCLLSISYYLHGSWRKAKAMSFAPPAETAPAAE